MSLPYMRFWVVDFDADTSHLTLAEDGAYNRLLRLCWRTPGCSIPDDDEWIMRRIRVGPEEYEAVVRPILREFFRSRRGRLSNKRQTEEYSCAKVRHETAVSKGQKGGRPRKSPKPKGKTETSTSSQLKPSETYPEPEPYKEDGVVDAGARASTRTRTRANPDLILVDEIIYAARVDPAKSLNGWLDGPVLASLSNWRGLGIPDDDIINTIRDVTSRKRDGPARSPTYFDGAMQKLAAELNRPPLEPAQLNGGSDGQRDGKDDEFRRIIAAAARGTSGKDWG